MKYLDILNKSAEETATENNALIAEEQSIAMQQAIFNKKKEASELKIELVRLKGRKSLDFDAIMTASDAIDINKRRSSQLTKLQKELF